MSQQEYLHKRVRELEAENWELRKQKSAYHTALWLTLKHFYSDTVIISPNLILEAEGKKLVIEQTEDLLTHEITLRIKEEDKEHGNNSGLQGT